MLRWNPFTRPVFRYTTIVEQTKNDVGSLAANSAHYACTCRCSCTTILTVSITQAFTCSLMHSLTSQLLSNTFERTAIRWVSEWVEVTLGATYSTVNRFTQINNSATSPTPTDRKHLNPTLVEELFSWSDSVINHDGHLQRWSIVEYELSDVRAGFFRGSTRCVDA